MTHLSAEQRKAVELLSTIPVEDAINGMRDTIAALRAELKQADDALTVVRMANTELREWLYARTPGQTRIVVTRGDAILEAIDLTDPPTYTRLAAENAELRRVLGQCEWGCPCGEKGGACPLCDAAFLRAGVGTKHKPDCHLGRALGRPECGEGT